MLADHASVFHVPPPGPGSGRSRSNPLVFDEIAERTIAVTFGSNVYSAVKLTDEQNNFDIDNCSKLLRPQSNAVARCLQRRAVNLLTGQTCSATIGNDQQNLRPCDGIATTTRCTCRTARSAAGRHRLAPATGFEPASLLTGEVAAAFAPGREPP